VDTTWDGLPIAAEPPYACCVVVWREAQGGKEFLVLHRVAPGGAGFEGDWAWTPPSGARQPGEAPALAATRELREETGLTVPVTRVPEAPSERVALFEARIDPGVDIVLDDEHDTFSWRSRDEATDLCLPAEAGACIANVARWLDAGSRAY
jgi:8-oxo-dGTP pyrophosphatase MutT (NUDIX family)